MIKGQAHYQAKNLILTLCGIRFSPLVLVSPLGGALPNIDTCTKLPLAGVGVLDSVHLSPTSLKPASNPCQKHQELLSGLPSKYCHGLMLINFSVKIGTGQYNMAKLRTCWHVISISELIACAISAVLVPLVSYLHGSQYVKPWRWLISQGSTSHTVSP